MSENPNSDSGKNGSYYDVAIKSIGGNNPGIYYLVSCIDVIVGLSMTFEEGEAFKAIWRKAAARQGLNKGGDSPLRNAEKVAYYGKVMENVEKGK